jgi:hypothetical protein
LTSEIPYRRGKVLYYLGAVGVLIIRDGRKKLTSFIPNAAVAHSFYS